MTLTRIPGRRAVAALALLVGSLALTGCEKPEPTITWYGNEAAVNSGPALYCELTTTPQPLCSTTNGPTATLDLNANDFIQVNIPAEVAAKPWLLVYSYVDDAESYRSPVFDDGHTLSYVIHPLPGKQLRQVDLQVPTLTASAEGAPQFTPLQAWVLLVNPV